MVALASLRQIISSIPTLLSAAASIGTGLGGMRGISKETVSEMVMSDIEAAANKTVTAATWIEVACSYNEELAAQETKKTPRTQAEVLAQAAAFEKLEQIVCGSEELAEKVKAKKNRKLTRKKRAVIVVVGVVNERIKNEIGSRIKEKVVPVCVKKFRDRNRCEITHHEEPNQTISASNDLTRACVPHSWARLCGIFRARIEAFAVERIEESIESLISSIMDTALERAIQSGGSVEIEMAETEHPQAVETETEEHPQAAVYFDFMTTESQQSTCGFLCSDP